MPNPDIQRTLVCALEGALLKTDLKSERVVNKAKVTLERLLSSNLDLYRLRLERAESKNKSFTLPLNQEVYDFLQKEKSTGRRLLLDTTEPAETVQETLADNYLFDATVNLKSGEPVTENFDYVGTSATPDEVWDNAEKHYFVGSEERQSTGVVRHFATEKADVKAALKAIRTYQWLKNLLVFVPIITSQQFGTPGALIHTIIMFFCFSAVASFGYVVNDLLDLQADRAHVKKRNRPFASGRLSVMQGIAIGAVLLILTAVGSLFLPAICSVVLLCYLALTITYSIYLKTKLMIDVVALGGLFTLRVIGGATAIETEMSFYLLSFSIFLFSSLGMVKRFAELHNQHSRNLLVARGRGYLVEDMAPVLVIGISLGYMSVFIMGLYINSPLITQYYTNPKVIWLLLPLLTYWLGRIWILAHRGAVNEDPLIFAVKDRTSLLVAALAAIILFLAI